MAHLWHSAAPYWSGEFTTHFRHIGLCAWLAFRCTYPRHPYKLKTTTHRAHRDWYSRTSHQRSQGPEGLYSAKIGPNPNFIYCQWNLPWEALLFRKTKTRQSAPRKFDNCWTSKNLAFKCKRACNILIWKAVHNLLSSTWGFTTNYWCEIISTSIQRTLHSPKLFLSLSTRRCYEKRGCRCNRPPPFLSLSFEFHLSSILFLYDPICCSSCSTNLYQFFPAFHAFCRYDFFH